MPKNDTAALRTQALSLFVTTRVRKGPGDMAKVIPNIDRFAWADLETMGSP